MQTLGFRGFRDEVKGFRIKVFGFGAFCLGLKNWGLFRAFRFKVRVHSGLRLGA